MSSSVDYENIEKMEKAQRRNCILQPPSWNGGENKTSLNMS